MTTSFKKKTTRGRPNLPTGTKPSLNNNQLLISTGIPSLDSLLSGGLAVGTLMLIEEDVYYSYANIMQKMFLAEGVTCDHYLFLASANQNPNDIIKEIPTNVNETESPTKESSKKATEEGLQIAWRYQNKPKVTSTASTSQFGHYFDLSQTLSEEKRSKVQFASFTPEFEDKITKKSMNTFYKKLLRSIKNTIDRKGLSTENSTVIPPILRISISSLGSPFWKESMLSSDEYDSSLAWFLLSLKSLLRRSYASCLVTVPAHLIQDESYINRLEHCCDTVIRLESFAGSEKEQNPLYKEYHGLFHLKKHAKLNCICGQNIDTSDLAFKLRRKKFVIEKLHLPPDISETASRSQGNTSSVKPTTPLCNMTTPVNNVLDF
ncbi:elongator complex protein 4-like isoform X2 [Hydractinia symbiolongicarpus]|uniref:elongator complex protein 4-like isoform X2 n=1 Tax=Hydractinia symbiolongicarpus TaxID=13093 RepID=UPI00254F3445|nr:elongator complex protein 4-like isoform X2 [Hydractinia symbiolongicarpus]